MANIVLGSIVSDIRGSVGAETYSRTLGGLIVKARSNPSQPASDLRDQVQANFSVATKEWSDELSEDQRQAWRHYAAMYPRPNRFGDLIITSGFLAFVRTSCSIKLTDPDEERFDPPLSGMLSMPVFTFNFWEAPPHPAVSISIDPSVPLEDISTFIVSCGKVRNEGVTYYSTPWQVFFINYYYDGSWIYDFDAIPLPVWAGTSGRIFLKAFMIEYYGGNLSCPFQTFADSEPPPEKVEQKINAFLDAPYDLLRNFPGET